jgi:hypothetical protein
LAELLQYDPAHRETTVCKAQAVEALAGEDAFIFPSRLVVLEVANAAHLAGLLSQAPEARAVTNQRNWHPNVGNVFGTLKNEIQTRLNSAIAETGANRHLRRTAKARSRKISMADFAEAGEQAVPQFARKWGLSETDVRKSLIAAIAGRITPEHASKMLFSQIAKPTTFVRAYFENYEGEKDLPFWMSKFGAQLQAQAIKLREAVQTIPGEFRPELDQMFRSDLREKLSEIGTALIRGLDTDDLEFGLSEELLQHYCGNQELAAAVPCCSAMSRMMVSFALESADLTTPEPQHSTGGDFIHALYARHSDLWRGDRRFAHFLRAAVPAVAGRIVSRLSDLPKRIRDLSN